MPANATQLSTNTQTRGAIRGKTQAKRDVLAILKNDHRLVLMAFREFDRLHRALETEACAQIVSQTCMALALHSRLEDEVFYPTVRLAIEKTELVEEAGVEHQAIQMLIDRLQTLDPADEKFAATFNVLGEYVKHHIREEEGTMFPKLNRANLDWRHLLDEMQEHQEAIRTQIVKQFSLDGLDGAYGKSIAQQ